MLMNQAGANIPYPYHDLPLITTHDRIGFWALLGAYEDLTGELYGDGTEDKRNRVELECGSKREDEK